jgi:hypothetical protein
MPLPFSEADIFIAAYFKMISCITYSSTLKMEATCSSETSVDFQPSIWRYNPEYRTLRNHQIQIARTESRYAANVMEKYFLKEKKWET